MTDLDRNIAEFSAAIGPLFAPHRREIEALRARIQLRTRRHKSRNELQRMLVRMQTQRLRAELAA